MLRLGATLLAGSLLGVTGGGVVGSADAQGVAELFGKGAPTVVVVRALDGGADGPGRAGDIGSGVVVSKDGKVMTAAHLVHGAGRLEVQFLGGRTVPAKVVATELAGDLSLLQLGPRPSHDGLVEGDERLGDPEE